MFASAFNLEMNQIVKINSQIAQILQSAECVCFYRLNWITDEISVDKEQYFTVITIVDDDDDDDDEDDDDDSHDDDDDNDDDECNVSERNKPSFF